MDSPSGLIGQETVFSPRHMRIFLLLTWVVTMFWFWLGRTQTMRDGETNDTYYHIAMAERGPSVFCAKKFPALELSVWRDHFADKELLYHWTLRGLLKLQELFGFPVRVPYHFPALVLIGLLCASLLFAMKRLGVAPPLYLPMTMLALMSAPNVMYRILMLRPHVLSLILMFFLCGQLAEGPLRRRLIWTLLISLVYAWSYSNPQFIVIPVLFFAFASCRQDGWKGLLLVVAALGGVMLGLLIHPQFPNTFLIWKVQSFDALFGPLLQSGVRQYSTLVSPQEMHAPHVIWNCRALPMYAFVYLNFLIFARLIAKLGWKNIPPVFYAVGGLSLLFTGGTFLVLRTIEYAGPFAGLFGAMVWSLALKEKVFLPGRDRPARSALILTLLTFIPAGFSTGLNIGYSSSMSRPATELGAWMERNLPEGELVVNLNWGEFPQLFHGSRKQVFLWGMDPEFSIAADPKRTQRIERMLFDRQQLNPRLFRRVTGGRYAVTLTKDDESVEYLNSIGWKTLYNGPDGVVFRVE